MRRRAKAWASNLYSKAVVLPYTRNLWERFSGTRCYGPSLNSIGTTAFGKGHLPFIKENKNSYLYPSMHDRAEACVIRTNRSNKAWVFGHDFKPEHCVGFTIGTNKPENVVL